MTRSGRERGAGGWVYFELVCLGFVSVFKQDKKPACPCHNLSHITAKQYTKICLSKHLPRIRKYSNRISI